MPRNSKHKQEYPIRCQHCGTWVRNLHWLAWHVGLLCPQADKWVSGEQPRQVVTANAETS